MWIHYILLHLFINIYIVVSLKCKALLQRTDLNRSIHFHHLLHKSARGKSWKTDLILTVAFHRCCFSKDSFVLERYNVNLDLEMYKFKSICSAQISNYK